MHTGTGKKNIQDIQFPITIEKERRFGGQWGRVRIVDGLATFTETGKDWIVDEFNIGWSVYNLLDNTAHAILANSATQITTTDNHNMVQDDPYFIGETTIGNVNVSVYENNLMNFAKSPKYNRSIEYPVGGVPYAINETLMVSGSLDLKWRTENLWMSMLGATCGWIDTVTGHMRWYNQNDYDYPMNVMRNDNAGVGAGFTNITTEAQKRTGFTPFTFLPVVGTMAIGDGPYICGGEIYNAIYFNLSTIGVAGAGDPLFDLEYHNGAGWGSLQTYVLDDDMGDIQYFDKVECRLLFIPPNDWERVSVAHTTVGTTYTAYGYLIRIVLHDAEVYATTNPVANYIALNYCVPSYTIREYFTRGVQQSCTVVNGVSPTKCEITIQKEEPVGVKYDYPTKGYVAPHSMATCTMPSRTRCYRQPLFYSPHDITVTWSSPTVTDINIENCKIIIDPKGEGTVYVGSDNGISGVDKTVPDLRFECDVPYTNDTFLTKYFADPTTDDGKISIAIRMRKEKRISTALGGAYAATVKIITLSTIEASNVHSGQMLSIKEDGVTTVRLIVTDVNYVTGAITFATTLGQPFTAVAQVYLYDYVKYTYTKCIFLDPSLDDKAGDNPIKRSWTLVPVGDLPTTIPLDITFWE